MTVGSISETTTDDWIEMQYGGMSLAEPSFRLDDLAHALSMCCRYTGRCKRFYSIASHSLLVARIMTVEKLGDPLEGLLHDAAESTMSDLASPIKRLPELQGYREVEHRFDRVIRRQFKLPDTKTVGCKTADWMALWMEAYVLMPSRGIGWSDPAGLRTRALQWAGENGWPYLIVPEMPLTRRKEFLDAFADWS